MVEVVFRGNLGDVMIGEGVIMTVGMRSGTETSISIAMMAKMVEGVAMQGVEMAGLMVEVTRGGWRRKRDIGMLKRTLDTS